MRGGGFDVYTETANANIKKALKGYFTINAKQLDGGINEETLEKILEIDGLSGNYKLRSYSYATYYDSDGNLLEINTDGALTPALNGNIATLAD